MNKCVFEDLGLMEYKDAWDYQEKLFDGMIQVKLYNREHDENTKELTNYLLFVEHPHVYTLGKSGVQNNLLINDDFLKNIHATYYKSNRGGDITYHGPGQIVGYPIFDLEQLNLTIREYIEKLEQAVINCIAEYGVKGERLEGATGVWLDTNIPGRVRKICAIGVKASRHVSMHGFAFNINTDLNYFSHINPCGFTDKGVTSLQKELGYKLDIDSVKQKMLKTLVKEFSLDIKKSVF